jgi:hypothetical protein
MVEYGGPRTAYDFPVFADDHAPGRLVSSYGGNNRVYDARTDIQGRRRQDHWGTFNVAAAVSDIPLFADAMWRGGGPDHRQAIRDAAPRRSNRLRFVEGRVLSRLSASGCRRDLNHEHSYQDRRCGDDSLDVWPACIEV